MINTAWQDLDDSIPISSDNSGPYRRHTGYPAFCHQSSAIAQLSDTSLKMKNPR